MHSQLQNVQPFRVVYDIEKNRYFRVNKITGQIEPSYKTGKTPAKFDPNITGANYLARSKYAHLRTIQSSNTESTSVQQYNSIKNMGDDSKKSLKPANLATIITEPIQSRISERREVGKMALARKKREKMNIEYNKIDETPQNSIKIKLKTLESDSVTLPKLHKRNSETHLEARHTFMHHQASPPNVRSLRNSQSNADMSFVSSKTRENQKDYSFVNSMNKLAMMSGESSVSQSRMELEKFENKLRKYCEIQESKLIKNHFLSLNNDQKSHKLQKFAQKRLLTSVLDQSHFTLDQTSNNLKMSRFDQSNHDRKAITRAQVQKTLDQLSRQKASLLLLSKKCQPRKPLPLQQGNSLIKKQSQPLMKAINLLQIEQKQKLKQQLHQEKQTFLSFYPTYAFKENPRLIKQQKDRKINLKKLELLNLENSEKKFGRIYHSESKDSVNQNNL